MTLTLLLPWFPILLAVGLGGRILGEARGHALGLLGALFWVAVMQASTGRVLWENPWNIITAVVGGLAIVAIGGWTSDAAGAFRSRGLIVDANENQIHQKEDSLDRLAASLLEFDDWLERHKDDSDPWGAFDEFLRGIMFRCCQATHVRPLRLLPGGKHLMPLQSADPRREATPVAARDGEVGDVLATGRSFIAGVSVQSNPDLPGGAHSRQFPSALNGENSAWCFRIGHGPVSLGVVVVGRLGICPAANRSLLLTVERMVNQFWVALRLSCQVRASEWDDPASGLLTREAFLRVAGESLEDSYRQSEPAALVVVALEGLRQLNDTGRWDVADELVKGVGQALRLKARSDDQLCRFDGSRFLILLRRVDSELANLIVAQFTARLTALCEDTDRWGATITVRCGVAGSGSGDLNALIMKALAQWQRARSEAISMAGDYSVPPGDTAKRSESKPARQDHQASLVESAQS